MDFVTKDSVLPMLDLKETVKIKIQITDNRVQLIIENRDWAWEKTPRKISKFRM